MKTPRQRTRTLVLALSTAVAAAGLAGCLEFTEGERGAITTWGADDPARLLLTLGDPATSGQSRWPGGFEAPPTAYDLDGDGRKEIIAHSSDRHVYVFDAASGDILAKLATRYPPSWYSERILTEVAVGVLRPGEAPTIVAASHAAYVTAWRFAGAGESSFRFEKVWESRLTACHRSPSMEAGPVLVDVTGDEDLEILVNTQENGLYALDADGNTLWRQCWPGGSARPVVADLDGNGTMEAIFASRAGVLAVVDAATGAAIWSFDVRQYNVTPGEIYAAPAVADLNGSYPHAVLITARNATLDSPAMYAENRMAILAVQQNGTQPDGLLLWKREPAWANPMSNTRIHVVGSGPDTAIFGMDWNTIGVRPGDWERLGAAHLFRLDRNGDDVWVREVDAWWSDQEIAVVDFRGDGTYHVLVNGPGAGGDGVWRLTASGGVAEGFLPLNPWKMLRGPVLTDLTGDGSHHLLVGAEPMAEGDLRGAVLVYDLGY